MCGTFESCLLMLDPTRGTTGKSAAMVGAIRRDSQNKHRRYLGIRAAYEGWHSMVQSMRTTSETCLAGHDAIGSASQRIGCRGQQAHPPQARASQHLLAENNDPANGPRTREAKRSRHGMLDVGRSVLKFVASCLQFHRLFHHRGHPERSTARAKEGRCAVKDPVEYRKDVSRKSTGSFAALRPPFRLRFAQDDGRNGRSFRVPALAGWTPDVRRSRRDETSSAQRATRNLQLITPRPCF